MKFEGNVGYKKPEDSYEEDEMKGHLFEIEVNGEVVAGAEVHYYSKPIPFYQVSTLYTEYEYKSRGMASAIMDKVEAFLIERKKPGILIDAIHTDVPEVEGMYLRRGWVPISDIGHMVFNLSESIDPSIFDNYSTRGQETWNDSKWRENRESFFKKP